MRPRACARRRRRSFRPASSPASQAVSDSVVSATIVSNLEPADAKGHTDDMRAAAGEIPGATALRLRPGRASSTTSTRSSRTTSRSASSSSPSRSPRSFSPSSSGRSPFLLPLIFAAAAIPTTLADHLDLRARDGADDLPAEPRHAHRARHRDRLLASDRLPLPRGAPVSGNRRRTPIVRTMETAGRAVVFSGSAVGIGLALMLFMPLPFMRGFGIGGCVIPLVSVVCALTAPAGARLLLRQRARPGRHRAEASSSSAGTRIQLLVASLAWGHAPTGRGGSQRRRRFLLLTRHCRSSWLEVGPGSNKGILQNLEGVKGLNVISERRRRGRPRPDRDRRGTPASARRRRPRPAVSRRDRRARAGSPRRSEVAAGDSERPVRDERPLSNT